MKNSTLSISIRAANQDRRPHEGLDARRDQGSICVETVVITLGLFALATLIIGLPTTWATGKLGGLN